MKQVEGPWPIDHPLPLPTWSQKQKPALSFRSVLEYEELASEVEFHVQKLLEEHNYDTVGNFVELYQNFKDSQCHDFMDFFQR